MTPEALTDGLRGRARRRAGAKCDGTTFDLSKLKDENGAAFPGIDGVGNWVVALECTQCSNPAPYYMAFLAPCNPGP